MGSASLSLTSGADSYEQSSSVNQIVLLTPTNRALDPQFAPLDGCQIPDIFGMTNADANIRKNSMSASKHREFACAILIDTLGRLLLQRRDNVPGILFPGRIGLFGGHREDNETFLQCVVREIHEEISYYVPPERFAQLARYEGVDPEVDNGTVYSETFVARDIPTDDLVITEGALVIAKPSELVAIEPQFTPVLRFAINAFLKSRPAVLAKAE